MLINKLNLWIATLALAFVVTLSFAQNTAFACGGGKKMWTEEGATEMINDMKARLNLTAKQETKLQAIFKDARKQADSLRARPKGPETFDAWRNLHWYTEDKVAETLTCTQREELRKMKREKKWAMKAEHMKNGGASSCPGEDCACKHGKKD